MGGAQAKPNAKVQVSFYANALSNKLAHPAAWQYRQPCLLLTIMTNTPLTSNDQAKILIFGLLLLPPIFFGVGIIPAIFLAFGIGMLKKNSDFSHIETAARNFRFYVMIFVLLFAGILAYLAFTDNYRADFAVSLNLSMLGVAVFYLIGSKVLFLNPLRRHSKWVEKNGIFSSKPKAEKQDVESSEISIIRGENLKTFSVAGELLKWAKLKEDGLISDQEYNEARKKLLQGN